MTMTQSLEKTDFGLLIPASWVRKAVLTVARIGKFSSDRTIREYMRDIWQIKPLPINLNLLMICIVDQHM